MIRSPQAVRPVARRSLAQAAYEEITAAIFERRFPPHSRLNVYELARQLEMSATPVREALSRIAAEGLVWQETNRGFRVAPLLDEGELRSLFDVRRILEMRAIEQAHMESDAMRQLLALAKRMDKMRYGPRFRDFDEYNRADAELHRRIVLMSDSPFLVAAWDSLRFHMHIGRLAMTMMREPTESVPIPPEHQLIVETLAKGNRSKAAKLLDAHISGALEPSLTAVRRQAEEETTS